MLISDWSSDVCSSDLSTVTNTLQPDVLLLEPQHLYTLTWDPPNTLQIVTRPKLRDGEDLPEGTRLPVFRLKNLGDAVAQDLTIKWQVRFPAPLERRSEARR